METGTMQHACGCVNMIDEPTGAIKNLLKCDHHKAMQRPVEELDESYYNELHALDPESPARYIAEFIDGFGQLPNAKEPSTVLEIGGGASAYVPYFVERGYSYSGLEPSAWARDWVRRTYKTGVDHLWPGTWEETEDLIQRDFDIIFCAHALEHMTDAPAAVKKMANHLMPGGVLYILVPDDTDLTNPDHLWFFNRVSLARVMAMAGLEVESMVLRQRVPHEQFIYCKARKPETVV